MAMRRFALLFTLGVFMMVSSLAKDSWVVRMNGVGPAMINMSLSQLNSVLHEKFATPSEPEERACFYVSPGKHPGVSFMIIDGRLARVDVGDPGVLTSTGIEVGDAEAHVLKVYGQRLKVEPHAYSAPQGHYLTAKSADGRYAIRFETDSGKITMFYAGRSDAIQYIEGCE